MSIGNGTSNPNIELKYKGFEQTRTDQSLNTQITFQSTQAKLMDAMSSTYKVGDNDQHYGRIDSLKLTQDAGPFWNLVVEYNQPLSSGLIISSGDSTEPTQNSLTIRMMSVPIQSHPNYCYIWNHSLASNYGSNQIDFAEISGLNAQEAVDFAATHSGRVKWIKSDSELPTEPYVEQNEGSDDTFTSYWKVNYYMTKPGVETYDYPTYEITEQARHKSRNNATWSLLAKNGKLRFPQYGDFGIENYFYGNANGLTATVSGHWLCEGAGINYDGKYYVANCTYLWSYEPTGWDQELYEVASGGYYSSNNHNPNSIFDGHGGN